MNLKLTLSTILFFITATVTFAQNGNINGSVKTSDGTPADLVSVAVKGTSKGALTDKNGNYRIRNVQAGPHILVATFIGLQTQEQSVTVKAGENIAVNFILKENASQLNEVVIQSRKSKPGDAIVAKMPLKNLENPQVYNSVSAELIKQQNITSYDDVMRNVPGISRTWESTGRAGDGASYFALRGFDAQPSLTNGLPGLTSGNLDVANVEEVQVIKGPSATLFGASFYSYGGIINTVTKKPYYTFGGDVSYNTGSYGLNRVALDINTPLSKTNKIALRVNTAYHTENSFQNAGFKRSFFIAPALTYEVNSKLKIDVMAEVLNENRAVAPVFFNSDRATPLPFTNIKDLNLNVKESFMSNDLTMKNPRANLQGQVNYKLGGEWNSQTVVSYGRIRSNGYYSYIYDDLIPDNNFTQDFHVENNITKTIDIQQNFTGDFKVAGLRNRLLVGLDYMHRTVYDRGGGWATVRYVTPQSPSVAFTNADGVEFAATPTLTKPFVDGMLAGQPNADYELLNSVYAAYASDVINITPQLMAMLSLRTDYLKSPGDKTTTEDDFNQFALSHKLGLVYQPVIDKVSVFANYMDAFINMAPSTVYDADGNPAGIQTFKPEHANQWETGVKTNLFNDRLTATLSYYNIKVTDRVYSDINFNSIQGGRVRSQGIEFDLNANITQSLNVIAGYSHNSTKVLAGDKNDFYNEPGRNPGGQGPSNQINFWANYKFVKGTLKNFGLGLGGNYASAYRVIDNSFVGVFDLPPYTLINSSVFYNGSKYRVTFNVNNITDKQYYIGYWSVNPQRQRNFAVSVAYKF